MEGGEARRYLHDGLSKVLGTPVAQAGLEGGADVVPVSPRLVAVLTRLPITKSHAVMMWKSKNSHTGRTLNQRVKEKFH